MGKRESNKDSLFNYKYFIFYTMPQKIINSVNIDTFNFDVSFDIYNRQIIFDASGSSYTNISGQGELYVQGIAFSLIDQAGVELTTIDFDNPQIPVPSVSDTYTLDLTSLSYLFLFQTYKIVGAIKDQDGNVYYTTPVYKKVCEPNSFNDSGYVDGIFQVTPNCIDNVLTIKELTPFTYNNQTPSSVTKSGNLYYPTGTISAIPFTGTPFSNNIIYTGQYRVNNDSIATYDLGDGVYALVSYKTDNVFDVFCSNKMSDVMCCIIDLQSTYYKQCNNAIGLNAKNKLDSILIPFMTGLGKEINGQDASAEVKIIKDTLKCSCGNSSIHQNEFTPINPATTSIVLQGVGGTTIPSPSVSGNTKTYNIASNTYLVVKADIADLAYSITIDTSVTNVVKYKIKFDYNKVAEYVLTAIGASPTLITQLNSLINISNFAIDLSNLNGGCIIDLSATNYFLSLRVPSSSAIIKNIVFGSTTYNAPGGLVVSDEAGIEAWLNGLLLGTFSANFSTGVTGSYSNILSVANTNNPVSMTFTTGGGDTVVLFQKTNKSLIAFLQAVVDYLCGMTTLQIALYQNLSLCTFDYNGNIITTVYSAGSSLSTFESGVAAAICNLANRIDTLTGLTCSKIAALFGDYPNASLSATSKVLSIVDGNCTAATIKQLAQGVLLAITSYSDVKAQFCAIDCAAPATCPDISDINMSMVGSDIGIYGVVWTGSPVASQTVTIKYRKQSDITFTTITTTLSVLPNGNLTGTVPLLITGLSTGTIYVVNIVNNCGGAGAVKQITTPTGSLYSNQFRVENTIYAICGVSPITLYSSLPFAPGTTMYSDIGLTTPLSGYTLISDTTGEIYNIDNVTGLVGSDTGLSCTSGTPNTYVLGNDSAIICGNVGQTLYTNGAFAVGKVLYSDASLLTVVTGYTFVVYATTIYSLNASTGVIGSSTGLTCSTTTFSGTLTIQNAGSANLIIDINEGLSPAITLTAGATANFGISNPINVPNTFRVWRNVIGSPTFTQDISSVIASTGIPGVVSNQLTIFVPGSTCTVGGLVIFT